MNPFLKYLLIVCFIFNWANAQIAIIGNTVYTMAGDPITDGVVLIKDGKFNKVGPKSKINIPKDYTIITGNIVTPGLIDAHSVVGLAGIYNQREDQDQLDKSNAIQPELRALDAYNAREELISWLRSYGITTVHTGHAPGALISGQSIIVKTTGETVEEALIDSSAMLTMTLGATVGRNFKSPGTRAKGMALLRNEFLKAQVYQRKMQHKDKNKRPPRDLKMEVLSKALSGKLPVLITAQRAPEIMSAIRLAREFGLNLVLDGAAESYLLIDEIKSAKIPVIIHPTMVRNYGDTENAAFTTAAILNTNGIPIAFQSGYESYVPKTRVVLFEAGVAVGHGMPFTDALESLTIGAAKILGIADRVGSLEKGKDADVVIFDGDPFEYLSHVCTVIINGQIVQQECK